jgi:hypothetical protein
MHVAGNETIDGHVFEKEQVHILSPGHRQKLPCNPEQRPHSVWIGSYIATTPYTTLAAVA